MSGKLNDYVIQLRSTTVFYPGGGYETMEGDSISISAEYVRFSGKFISFMKGVPEELASGATIMAVKEIFVIVADQVLHVRLVGQVPALDPPKEETVRV